MSQVTEVARDISDYGLLIVIGAAFIVLSFTMWVAIFQWFKAIINKILDDYKKSSANQQDHWQALLTETQRQNEKLNGLLEGLRPETQLRIRNLTGFAFDLSVENVCRLIKRIRKENHIDNKEATAEKIRKALKVIHDDRNSKFDPFTYRGMSLSCYCDEKWIEQVAQVVEGEIYHIDGENNARAYTNVKLAYDDIKTNFYKRLTKEEP